MRSPLLLGACLAVLLPATRAGAEIVAPAAAATRGERIKLAVFDLKASGVPEDLAGTLTSVVSSELGRLDVFSVISQQEIRALISHEQMGQALGCDQPACTADLGQTLGVRFLVTGNVGKVGNTYSLNLSLTNAEKGAVEGRESATVKETSALLDTVARSAKQLVSKVLGERQGTLIVTCAEVGATVTLDDKVIGVTPLPKQQASWGPHFLVVEKKGFVTAQEEFSMTTNGFVERSISMIPSPDFLNEYQAGTRRMRIGAWLTTGAAAAAIAAASYFQIIQTQQTEKYDTLKGAYQLEVPPVTADYNALVKQHGAAESSLDATYAFIGLAGLAGASSIYFWVAGGDPNRYARYKGVTSADPPPSDRRLALAIHFLQGGLVSATW